MEQSQSAPRYMSSAELMREYEQPREQQGRRLSSAELIRVSSAEYEQPREQQGRRLSSAELIRAREQQGRRQWERAREQQGRRQLIREYERPREQQGRRPREQQGRRQLFREYERPMEMEQQGRRLSLAELIREYERPMEMEQQGRRRYGYISSTRRVNIQSSDGRGQVTKASYEDTEIRSHVTGAVSTSETVREGEVDKVKVTTQKGSQGHKNQEPVTKSAETSSYVTTSKKDTCTEGFSSTPATSEQPQALAFSPLAPPAEAAPPPSTFATPPEAKDEVTQLAQKLLKAVNSKKKSDQDSLNVLSEQLDGNVIMIQNTVNNNHYHTHYHNHNNTCEEVRVETSETVNVCVGGLLKVDQRRLQNDDNGDEDVDKNSHGTDADKENDDDEDSGDHMMHVDMDDEDMEK